MIDVKIYEQRDGKCPFEKWLDSIGSKPAKSRILKTLTKLETGLLSDVKPVGNGVQEIRLHFEKGYRLYFGYDGDKLIILLVGSDKSDQKSAIKKAHTYWADYKEQKKKAKNEETTHETRKRAHRAATKKR